MSKLEDDRRPVLVPVDFSGPSIEALRFAVGFCRGRLHPLLLLHVVHDGGSDPSPYRMDDEGGNPLTLEEAGAVLMQRFRDRVEREIPIVRSLAAVEYLQIPGLPSTRILEFADEKRACLIVMGDRGQGGLSRLVMGSTASKVLKDARVPVTLVKAPSFDEPNA